VSALALNLLLVGSCVAVTAAVAVALVRGAHPRARYLAALLAFVAAAVLPLVLTFLARPSGAARLVVVERVAASVAPARGVELVWLALAALLLARELLGHLALRRRAHAPADEATRRALAWPADVPLFVGDDGPATLGLWRPRVVLPRAWLARDVARHELAHARWRDPLVHAAVRVVRALLWPALPLWYLEAVVRVEREAAADAAAAALGDAHAYASTLLAVARSAAGARRSSVGIAGIGLEERIERLLAPPARPGPTRRVAALLAVLAGATSIAALPVGGVCAAMPLHAVGDEWLDAIIAGTRYHDHAATEEVLARLARFRDGGSLAPLAAVLRHDDERVRESGAWIAGLLGDRRAEPLLSERLGDADPHTREAADWALRRLR